MLEQAEANLRNLKPLDIEVPVNPKYTIQEWLEIYAAQNAPPEKYANFKKGTTPQPGNDTSHRINFSFFLLAYLHGSSNNQSSPTESAFTRAYPPKFLHIFFPSVQHLS
jgi:hypothetical protein